MPDGEVTTTFNDNVSTIETAVYGSQVRSAIAYCMRTCYSLANDVSDQYSAINSLVSSTPASPEEIMSYLEDDD